jgi:predicted  nucleic acid-binding Zn-ribbon protein
MADDIRIQIVRLEHEIESVRDRIKDIEWRMDHGEKVSRDARTKAIDKLRHLNKELLKLEEIDICRRSLG